MQNQTEERSSWLKLAILLAFIGGFIALNIATGDADININLQSNKMVNMFKLAQAISVVIIFILPAVLFAQFWTTKKIHYLGLTRLPAINTAACAIVAMLLATPLINWLAELNQHMQLPASLAGMEQWMKSSEEKAAKITEAFMNTTSVKGLLLNLFVIAFMAALSEEIFFRGLLQKILVECFGNVHIAVWTGAILFSAFHMQFYGFLPRTVMGAFLGYLFLWSGSLWLSILAHFTNNGAAVLFSWLNKRGVISGDAESIGTGSQEWIAVTASIALVSALMYWIYRSEKSRKALQVI
jgi:membrane protease YdiL (CAAX protease family)